MYVELAADRTGPAVATPVCGLPAAETPEPADSGIGAISPVDGACCPVAVGSDFGQYCWYQFSPSMKSDTDKSVNRIKRGASDNFIGFREPGHDHPHSTGDNGKCETTPASNLLQIRDGGWLRWHMRNKSGETGTMGEIAG